MPKLSSVHSLELDGLRGVAVALVIFTHYLHTPSWGVAAKLGAVYPLLSIGWVGVDLFFVLSGFLIGGILFDNRESSSLFSTFYLRRACRIYPIYLLLIASFVLIMHVGAPAEWMTQHSLPLWSYLTFTQNFLMLLPQNYGHSWMGVTWSLAIEEQFYLVLPLIVFLFSRQTVLKIAVGLVIASPLLRTLLSFETGYTLTFSRLDGLFSGVILAHLVRTPAAVEIFRKNLDWIKYALALMSLGLIALCYERMRFGALSHTWVTAFFCTTVLVVYIDRDNILSRAMRLPVLTKLGGLAYGLYLCHEPINGLMHAWAHGGGDPEINGLPDLALTALSFLISIGVAAISYRFIEKPIIAYGKRFSYGTAATVKPPERNALRDQSSQYAVRPIS